MKCCIYCRVSTSEQELENQLLVLTEWAEQRGFQVLKVYQEEESAWRAGHQRELAQLVADARRCRFRVVLIWALDRLSREGSAAVLGIVSKLSRYGVKVLSYQESWTKAPWRIRRTPLRNSWLGRQDGEPAPKREGKGRARSGEGTGQENRPTTRQQGQEKTSQTADTAIRKNLVLTTVCAIIHGS